MGPAKCRRSEGSQGAFRNIQEEGLCRFQGEQGRWRRRANSRLRSEGRTGNYAAFGRRLMPYSFEIARQIHEIARAIGKVDTVLIIWFLCDLLFDRNVKLRK